MALSPGAKERALRAVFADSPTYLGLATRRDENGNLIEVNDTAYRRQKIAFDRPQREADGTVRIMNKDDVTFPIWDADSPQIRHWFIISTAGGEGELLASGDMARGFLIDGVVRSEAALDDLIRTGAKDSSGAPWTLGAKATLPVVYVAPQAGEDLRFYAGDIDLYIGDEEA